MAAVRRPWTRLVLAALLPVAVAAAWIPARDHVPNTNLALALVVVIGGLGWFAGWRGALVSALAAGASFDLIDTKPYGALTMSRGDDISTALILLLTGLLVGCGASRLARYRNTENHRADALAVVMEASGLVATGQEQRLVTEALAAELRRELDLASCTFHPQPPSGTRPTVARDGGLVGLITGALEMRGSLIDLPVWSQGEVVGHYRLVLGSKRPSKDELRVALSLADQAGAAMAWPDHEPPPDEPSRRLKLVPADPGPAVSANRPEERVGKSETGPLAAAPSA